MPLTQCSSHSAFIHIDTATLILSWDSHCSPHIPVPWLCEVHNACLLMNSLPIAFVNLQIFCTESVSDHSQDKPLTPHLHSHILSRYMHTLPVIQSTDPLCYTTVPSKSQTWCLSLCQQVIRVWGHLLMNYKFYQSCIPLRRSLQPLSLGIWTFPHLWHELMPYSAFSNVQSLVSFYYLPPACILSTSLL